MPFPNPDRYDTMPYRRAGRSGLRLPAISLGLFQNFGEGRDRESAMQIVGHAFDNGITHFDLANNYGPPPGAAETLFGTIIANELRPYRDEIVVSSKAGYDMWPGPYGSFGSRKQVIASAEQSLKRLGLEYVDIFYSHRLDPETPLEETMGALASLVHSGKALYVGISNYPRNATERAQAILADMGVPLTLHQPSYSVLNRWIETDGTLSECARLGIGVVPFGVLGHGLLRAVAMLETDQAGRALPAHHTTEGVVRAARALSDLAKRRGQSSAQLALAWVLRRPEVTSALVGVRTLEQLKDLLGCLDNLCLSEDEIAEIEAATNGGEGLVQRRPADLE